MFLHVLNKHWIYDMLSDILANAGESTERKNGLKATIKILVLTLLSVCNFVWQS